MSYSLTNVMFAISQLHNCFVIHLNLLINYRSKNDEMLKTKVNPTYLSLSYKVISTIWIFVSRYSKTKYQQKLLFVKYHLIIESFLSKMDFFYSVAQSTKDTCITQFASHSCYYDMIALRSVIIIDKSSITYFVIFLYSIYSKLLRQSS